ncbi:MAG: hypothetical protein R3B06_24685 [Kofleriaceae bacterium]
MGMQHDETEAAVVAPLGWGAPAAGRFLLALVAAAAIMIGIELWLVVDQAGRLSASAPAAASSLAAAAVALVGAGVANRTAALGTLAWRIRAVVVLAAVQAAIALVALGLWMVYLARTPSVVFTYPLGARVGPIAGVAGALVIAAALVAPTRRAVTAAFVTIVTLALAAMLALAAWLPLYQATAAPLPLALSAEEGAATARVLAWALVVPGVLAVLATVALAWRRRPVPVAQAGSLGLGWIALMALALDRYDDELSAPWQYAATQLAPVLLGLAWFAIMAVLALAIIQARALRRAGRLRETTRTVRGTVVVVAPASTTVGALVSRGWLAGLASRTVGFTLRTADGDVPVPAGAELVVPTPPWAQQARTGQMIPVVSDGDEVTVAGFDSPTDDGDAYRGGRAPLLGTRGLAVLVDRRRDETRTHELVLRMWRPSAVLLAVCVAAATPTFLTIFR